MLPWVVGVQKKGCAVLNHFSRVRLFGTIWTVACQATLSMGFSRQECWSGWPFLPLGDWSSKQGGRIVLEASVSVLDICKN